MAFLDNLKMFGAGLNGVAGALQPLADYQTQRQDMENLMKLAAHSPDPAGALANFQRIQQGTGYGGTPAAIQEYQYLQRLSPEQQKLWFQNKRGDMSVNLGNKILVRNPDGTVSESYDVGVNPNNDPALKAAQEAAKLQVEANIRPTIAGDITRAQETAKVTAAKDASYPQVEARVDNNVKVIDDLLAHPGFEANFGKRGLIPNIPGTAAADARTYIDQISGNAFLTAIGELKGSGAISEKEGDAATSAVARLSTAQSAESARKALNELKGILQGSKQRAASGTSYQGNGQTMGFPMMSEALPQGIDPVTLPPVPGINTSTITTPGFNPGAPSPRNVIRYDAQGNRIQ